MASLVEMMDVDVTPKPEEMISSSAPRPPPFVTVEARSERPDFFWRLMRRRARVSSSPEPPAESESKSESSESFVTGGGVAGRFRIEDLDLLLRLKKGTIGAGLAGGASSAAGIVVVESAIFCVIL